MIRVLIFEDSKVYLEGMKILLSSQQNLLLVGAYANAIGAVSKVAKCNPDVIIMDIKMPDVSGIQAVREIKESFSGVQILMLTTFEDDNSVFASICAGAAGYLLKGTSPTVTLQAIEEVYSGGSPMTPMIARKVLQLFQQRYCFDKEFYDLTEREKEILRCLVDGQSYKMIADTLQISYHTVNAHFRKIYDKLHVNSSQEAISKVLKQKLI